MESKKVHIVICEYSPPFKDGRVTRIESLTKFLFHKGFRVHTYSYGIRSEKIDSPYAILHQVRFPGMSHVTHGKSNESLSWSKNTLVRLSRSLFPDRYVLKIIILLSALEREINVGDSLILSVPRFSPLLMLMSNKFSKDKYNIIIDYRDLWSNNNIFTNCLTRVFAKVVENLALAKSRAVTVTTSAAANYMGKRHKHVVEIRNGISQDDLNIIKRLKKCKIIRNIHNSYVVSYFGTLGNKRVCVDFLKNLARSGVELRLYGNIDNNHRNAVIGAYKGFLGKEEMFAECLASNFIFVMILPEENDQYAIPGKIYELVATGVPLILFAAETALIRFYLDSINYPYTFFSTGKNYDSSNIKVKLESAAKAAAEGKQGDYQLTIREFEFEKILPLLNRKGTVY
jgi:hypothetical protein